MNIEQFRKNIISTYGEKGKEWLLNLQKNVDRISSEWNLSKLEPVENLTYSYVLTGMQGNIPIVLKLSIDAESLKNESIALRTLKGVGVVKILNEQNGAILLERANPGHSLKSFFLYNEKEAVEIICNLINKMKKVFSHVSFPHIEDLLKVLDKEWDIPLDYLQKARKLRDSLLQSPLPNVLLHGDLHHDNILKNGDDWIAIDPKGVFGEIAYEITSFIYNPLPELVSLENAEKIIQDRIELFSKKLNIDKQRIKEWCFTKLVLSWIWALENGIDPNHFAKLVRIFNNILLT